MNARRVQVAIFQHMESEGPGIFPDLLAKRGVPFGIHRLDETGVVPSGLSSPLIIMGGAMSVHDEREFPFLAGEKEIIRRHIRKGIPVVGICLGAQLIADAAGARVYPYRKELGWRGIERESADYFPGFPDRMEVFQFHGDTFDLPAGATLLWRGREVRNQMFLHGSAAGIQFHPEITVPLITDWMKGLPAPDFQRLLDDSARLIPACHAFCEHVVDRFLLGGAA